MTRAINKTQLLVLHELETNGNYATVTSLIENLSEKHNLAKSTVRWNINQLLELGLIECGDSKNKGTPAKLNKDGYLILKILEGDM